MTDCFQCHNTGIYARLWIRTRQLNRSVDWTECLCVLGGGVYLSVCVCACRTVCVGVSHPFLLRENRLVLWEESPIDNLAADVITGSDKNQQTTCKLTWTGFKLLRAHSSQALWKWSSPVGFTLRMQQQIFKRKKCLKINHFFFYISNKCEKKYTMISNKYNIIIYQYIRN